MSPIKKLANIFSYIQYVAIEKILNLFWPHIEERLRNVYEDKISLFKTPSGEIIYTLVNTESQKYYRDLGYTQIDCLRYMPNYKWQPIFKGDFN